MDARSEKQPDDDLGLSLVKTLSRSELASVAADLGEVSFDVLLEPGILRDIPVLATLAGVWRAGRTVRDHVFTKKLLLFLQALSKVPQDQRLRMIQKLEADAGFGRKVGDEIVLLLDRLDAVPKAVLLGKAFKAYCEGSISVATLQRINYAIDRIMMTDLLQLPEYSNGSARVSPLTAQAFVNGGLAYIPPKMASTEIRMDAALCADLVKHVLQA